jgi:phosphoglycerate dehydrogenase-like enzyme
MKADVLVLHPQAEVFAKTLGGEYPGVTFRTAHNEQEALGVCGDSNVIIAMAHGVPASVVAKMPRLNWIQALTTGTDHLLTLNLSKDIVVTSGRGIHGPQMSEIAFLYMLTHFRDIRRLLHNQSQAKWQNWPQRLLWGKTVTILGVGAISEQLALRCKAFDMRVVGVSSSRTNVANFDKIYPRERIYEAAAEADVFVVLIPYSPETHHIVDGKVLAAMKPSALLINIARGKCIDEPALTEALAQKRIAAAGLDVFEVEPLPPESPLWAMDNVVITPRVGGFSDVYVQQVMPVVRENIGIYLSGRPSEMRNIVTL